MAVRVGKKAPKRRGRDDWDKPPLKEWIKAKFVKAEEKDGQWGSGWNFQFKVIDPALSDLNIGSLWGLKWEPCYPGRDLYEWMMLLSDGELEELLEDVDDDEELDFDVNDYKGAVVDVFCELSDTGYTNVTDIRKPKKSKRDRADGKRTRSKPAAKKRRSRDDDDEDERNDREDRDSRRRQRPAKKRTRSAGDERSTRRRRPRDEDEGERPARSRRSRSADEERPAKKRRSGGDAGERRRSAKRSSRPSY